MSATLSERPRDGATNKSSELPQSPAAHPPPQRAAARRLVDCPKSARRRPIAALYVETGGCYFGLPDVDPWDKARDARLYDGPYPVVAHPPCERWGYFWAGSPIVIARSGARKTRGDDGGCFAAALAAVRRCGGVLEHPEGSHAWRHFGLVEPAGGAWETADFAGGWTCRVDQGRYGHRARKPTWLYAFGVALPSLEWRRAPMGARLRAESDARMKERGTEPFEFVTHGEARATPEPFRDLLLSIARSTYEIRAREPHQSSSLAPSQPKTNFQVPSSGSFQVLCADTSHSRAPPLSRARQ